MGKFAGAASVVAVAVTMTVTIFAEPHMTPAFFEKAADLYPLLLLALVVQQRYFVFDDPNRQSPFLIAALLLYAVVGEAATLLAIGQPESSDSLVKWTIGGLSGLLVAIASIAFSSAFAPKTEK